MGRILLRGRAKPVDVFGAAPDWPEADRIALAEAVATPDCEEAAAKIKTLLERYPADSALQNLLQRTRSLNEEGAYVVS